MLWNKYPDRFDELTLAAVYKDLQGNPPNDIPFLVWLLENPDSPLCLPGNINLFGHDCIHLLLKKGFTPEEEAYVIGFTMGNSLNTRWVHLLILKIAAYFLYPYKYRLTRSQLKIFDRGVRHGQTTKTKNINRLDWNEWKHKLLKDIRLELELDLSDRCTD